MAEGYTYSISERNSEENKQTSKQTNRKQKGIRDTDIGIDNSEQKETGWTKLKTMDDKQEG